MYAAHIWIEAQYITSRFWWIQILLNSYEGSLAASSIESTSQWRQFQNETAASVLSECDRSRTCFADFIASNTGIITHVVMCIVLWLCFSIYFAHNPLQSHFYLPVLWNCWIHSCKSIHSLKLIMPAETMIQSYPNSCCQIWELSVKACSIAVLFYLNHR